MSAAQVPRGMRFWIWLDHKTHVLHIEATHEWHLVSLKPWYQRLHCDLVDFASAGSALREFELLIDDEGTTRSEPTVRGLYQYLHGSFLIVSASPNGASRSLTRAQAIAALSELLEIMLDPPTLIAVTVARGAPFHAIEANMALSPFFDVF